MLHPNSHPTANFLSASWMTILSVGILPWRLARRHCQFQGVLDTDTNFNVGGLTSPKQMTFASAEDGSLLNFKIGSSRLWEPRDSPLLSSTDECYRYIWWLAWLIAVRFRCWTSNTSIVYEGVDKLPLCVTALTVGDGGIADSPWWWQNLLRSCCCFPRSFDCARHLLSFWTGGLWWHSSLGGLGSKGLGKWMPIAVLPQTIRFWVIWQRVIVVVMLAWHRRTCCSRIPNSISNSPLADYWTCISAYPSTHSLAWMIFHTRDRDFLRASMDGTNPRCEEALVDSLPVWRESMPRT